MSKDALTLVNEAVAQAEKELAAKVFTAVRVTNRGNVAFMGIFTTREAAEAVCQNNYKNRDLEWEARDLYKREFETVWLSWTDMMIRYVVAERNLDEHP